MTRAAFLLAFLALVNVNFAGAQVDWVAMCKSEVRGTKIWMSSAIDLNRPDLHAGLNNVDINRYCDCYHRALRQALGEDLYKRSRAITGEMSNEELMKNSLEDTKAVISCVEAQVARSGGVSGSGGSGPGGASGSGGPYGPAGASNLSGASDARFAAFMRGTVSPAAGIAGLKPGDSKSRLFQILGPTRTMKPLADGGATYYYGRNTTEIVVRTSAPPAETIRNIEVDFQFAGTTPGGGRMRDSRARIKETYPGKLAAELPDFLIYCDGTTFVFSDGRLDSIRAATLDSDVFKDSRIKTCR